MLRTLRRAVFATGLVAVAAILCAHLPVAQPRSTASAASAIDWEKVNAEAVAKLAEYIRVDTSDPPGNEVRAAEWFKRIFEAEGIPYETAESAPGAATSWRG